MSIKHQNQTGFKKTRGEKYYKNLVIILSSFLFAFIFASIFAPVNNSSAEEQEVEALVTNTLSGVSVTAGQETITLNVGQPSPVGTVVKASDILTAQTASSGGYQLYISTNSNATGGNRLYLSGDTSAAYIAPNHDSSGTDIAFGSETTLSSNSWGFTMDNTKYDNGQFAAVPTMGSEALIKSTSVASEDEIPIYFGVNVNTNLSTGSYTGNIIYTIIAEDTESDSYSTPAVSLEKGVIGSQLTITLPLRSAITSLSELGTIKATVGGVDCSDQDIALNNASLSISCTAPTQQTRGAKDVSVYIQQYGETYTKQSGFTYITYMHEMSAPICQSIKTNSTDILKDIRGKFADSSTPADYSIIKALDGNCWMRDNLNLYNMTISSDYSDFGTGTYTIPGTSTWSTNLYTEPRVHRATRSGYTEQVYYNWTTAVALQDGSTTEQQDQSICPKNWQLPINGGTSVDKSYAKLLYDSGNITTASQLFNSNLGFTQYYGRWGYDHNSEYDQGSIGTFWSSTPASVGKGYSLYYYSGLIDTQYSSNQGGEKGYGFTLRCVARN